MAKIYVASSWKNELQQKIVALLREQGHKVYDFTKPKGEFEPSAWETVSLNPDECAVVEFADAVMNPEVNKRFNNHVTAMTEADTAILLLPCGRSAHAEAGFMAGLGKRVFVFGEGEMIKPELMYLLFDAFTNNIDELLKWVDEPIPGVCRVCGCTEENPCFNPKYGYCTWADNTQTICSHCADKNIADDPQTKHCVNDKTEAFR